MDLKLKPALGRILSQVNPFHVFPLYCLKIHLVYFKEEYLKKLINSYFQYRPYNM